MRRQWALGLSCYLAGSCVAGCAFFKPQTGVTYNPLSGTWTFSTSQEQTLTAEAEGVEAWKDNPETGDGLKIAKMNISMMNESARVLAGIEKTMLAFTAQQQKFNEGLDIFMTKAAAFAPLLGGLSGGSAGTIPSGSTCDLVTLLSKIEALTAKLDAAKTTAPTSGGNP